MAIIYPSDGVTNYSAGWYNTKTPILRYITVWTHYLSGTQTDSAGLFQIAPYDTIRDTTPADGNVVMMAWSEGINPFHLDILCGNKPYGGAFHRSRAASALPNNTDLKVLICLDTWDLDKVPLVWVNDTFYTATTIDKTGISPGDPAWPQYFREASDYQKVFHNGGWMSGTSNWVGSVPFTSTFYSQCMWVSNKPAGMWLANKLGSYSIDPLNISGFIPCLVTDYEDYPSTNYVNNQKFEIVHNFGESLPDALSSPQFKFPISKKPRVHIRQEIPETPVADLFPNTVFYDTFTDTNGTLIDSHTPDTHTFSYGWEKLGATSYPQIQNNRLTFNADGAINTARLNTGIDITTNAMKLTGKIVQSISSTEAISIYIGDDQLRTSYYIPKNGFEVGFNSNLDIVSIKLTNNEIETPLLAYNYDYGSAGDSQYFEIICYSNGVNEVRIWPVRTAIGGGEVPFNADYPLNPIYRAKIFQDEWLSSGLKRIVLSTWYGSANQWSMDWLKVESSAEPLSGTSPGVWNRKVELRIDPFKAQANLTNFPLLLTENNLPSEMFDSDGLYPAQNGGGDIRFTSDIDGKYLLPCEVVDFVTDPDPANGKAQIWTKVPSITGLQSTGFTLPGSASTGTPDLGGSLWTNINNILTDANTASVTEATAGAPSTSNTLKGYNYGFNIPSDALIVGVEVQNRPQPANDLDFWLTENNIAISSVKETSASNDIITTTGGPADLWGATLTPEIVNSNTFGVYATYSNDPPGADNFFAFEYYLKINVYYIDPAVSPTSIYVWYNTEDTKTQYPDTHDYGRNAVWSDYELVTHDIVVDSTGNHTIDLTGTTPGDGVFGTKYGALGFGTTVGDATTDIAITSKTDHISGTYQAWAYRVGAGGGGYGRIFAKTTTTNNSDTCFVDTASANQGTYYVREWSTLDENKGVKPPFPTNTWYKLDITYDSSSAQNDVLIYQQGIDQSPLWQITGSNGTLVSNTNRYTIGNRELGDRDFNGYLAEFRLRNSILSKDWLIAEYNNQSSPATFVTEGGSAHAGHLLPNTILDITNLTGDLTDIDDIDIDVFYDDDNWLIVTEPALIDTFTDTNSTQIQNHTPELSIPNTWVKNGVTTYPQIQSNKLVFNASGASETAEIDLGLLGTSAFSKPFIISGEVTWLSPGGGVMTIEIGEKPLWTGLQINSTGFLLNLDDELSRVTISKRISEVETVVDTYSGYDWTANSGVHSFEMKVYSTGVMEARVWPSSSSRPSTATCTYDYSADSAIYTMTSRELTIATWVNTNFELNDIYVEDSFIPTTAIATADTLGGSVSTFPIAGSWTGTSNILVDDNNSASWTGLVDVPFTTTALRVTNFGFSLPTDAIVTGVEVKLRKLQNQLEEYRLSLINGGSVISNIQNIVNYPNDPSVADIGGINYDWGVTIDKNIVNSSTFGIEIQGVTLDPCSGAGSVRAEVAWVKIYYESKRDF